MKNNKNKRIELLKFIVKYACMVSALLFMNSCNNVTGQPNIEKKTNFELTSSLYAWEIHDEGIDQILDNLSIAGINSIYLISPMHGERRPFIEGFPDGRDTYFFPHNPVRKEWMAEDSRLYFFPDMSMYGKIKPLQSDYNWLSDTNWLDVVIKAARARGMRVGAEVSHTYLPQSLLDRNPQWRQINLDGTPNKNPCINNPDVQEYLIALYSDLSRNYDIDYIMTCMLVFSGNGASRNTSCICPHCQEKAKSQGFDLTAAIPVMRDNGLAYPEVEQFMKFREDATTEIYTLIIDKMHKENPGIEFRLNDLNNWNTGLNLSRLTSRIGSVHMSTHQEQHGNPNTSRISRIKSVRHFVGPDIPILASVTTRLLSTPDIILNMIKQSVNAGVQGLGIKHYDGTPFSRLRAVRNGLHEAGVESFSPILGIELEKDMILKGFSSDFFLTENGVRLTEPEGTAWSAFTYQSGKYDIAVTYTDEKLVKGSLEVLVGSKPVAKWNLAEDVDCWRRKVIPGVEIKNGEEIKLVASSANSTEDKTIRIDFIEFIPK
ncbi:MAG: hypothetical protein LBJ60_02580 [Tannerellaceae bacterium]|jgi:hypothetical protein|nr:hypothetical protein [Tannerellaceae bacterium]